MHMYLHIHHRSHSSMQSILASLLPLPRGRAVEAWMNVYNVDGDAISEPFFHISQGTADTSTVQIIKDGYFSVAFFEDGATEGVHKPLPFIVDPTVVFGTDTTLTNPSGFFGSKYVFETIKQYMSASIIILQSPPPFPFFSTCPLE